MYLVPLIPYLFLFLSLRDKQGRASMSSRLPILEFTAKLVRKMITLVHAQRHPELLHH